MRVKTGEIATVELNIDVQFRCSSCGTDNVEIETIRGSAQTPTIIGINTDRNFVSRAQDALKANLDAVLDQNNPKRFRAAGFTCKCRNCGHTEPWARMTYDHLEKPKTICLSILIVSAIMSITALSTGDFGPVHCFFYVLLALSAAACIGISAYKNSNNEKMEKLIAALPKESLPTILPHSKERHDALKPVPKNNTPKEVTYATWICKECGAQNTTQSSQCRKCGKYKTS